MTYSPGQSWGASEMLSIPDELFINKIWEILGQILKYVSFNFKLLMPYFTMGKLLAYVKGIFFSHGSVLEFQLRF